MLDDDLVQNNSKLQIADQTDDSVLQQSKNEPQEWIMTPAELYGCLCHKPNSINL